MDQAYAGLARATKRADVGVGYRPATAVHNAEYGVQCGVRRTVPVLAFCAGSVVLR
jgi:hypothetical protein